MSYRAVFEAVMDHLDRIGVPYSYVKKRPAAARDVAGFEKRSGLALPVPLRAFYLSFSDGANFYWQDGEDFGAFTLPSSKEMGAGRKEWEKMALTPDEDFPLVEDAALARATLAEMRRWLPLDEDGEGDKLCLDCGAGGGAVRYHQHDWFDGGSGRNGLVLAPDFDAFLVAWSRACFFWPSWWPGTVGDDGVDWGGDGFPARYRCE
jgi:cell wall assembly regulator SMI1